jgi:hypothetical protein
MIKFNGEADAEYKKVKGYIQRMLGQQKLEKINRRWEIFQSDQSTVT